ncbi:MAG TPA: enoyl-CoA hydratase/isomerase family protein, partial [Thermoanaerobaculia bacterium]|nr:enoyl-CoA hydratase/isomerase family protein [Thermoanaerobaculia bacterium]
MSTAEKLDSATEPEVLYDVDGAIATITLNAPHRMNTISGPMLEGLAELLVRANEDPGVRVVILTATGRAFCAGLDLKSTLGGGGASLLAGPPTTLDLRNAPPTVLHRMDTPVVCALNGSAAGYGMDTALGCDIRVMAEDAKLSAAFTRRG